MKHIHHTKHFYRAIFILLGAVFAFLVIRGFLIPTSFGEFGFYRGDAVREQMALPITFGGLDSCNECHKDIVDLHASGKHQMVQCQNCHAPLTVHIEEGEFKELMPINRSPKLCLRCHRRLPSRPSQDFPQIDVKDHTGLPEKELSTGFCLQCHRSHNPTPGDSNE